MTQSEWETAVRERDISALWGECVERNARYWQQYNAQQERVRDVKPRCEPRNYRQERLARLRAEPMRYRIAFREAARAIAEESGLALRQIIEDSHEALMARRAIILALRDGPRMMTLEQITVAGDGYRGFSWHMVTEGVLIARDLAGVNPEMAHLVEVGKAAQSGRIHS